MNLEFNRLRQNTTFWLEIIGVVILFGAGIDWMVFQWGECRAMEFSFWYCVQHIV